MPRITRIAGSFAIVVIAYWAYALAAVPRIEPTANLGGGEMISPKDRAAGGDLVDPRISPLRPLFPAGALDPKKVSLLESGRSKLLFERYHNFPDGRVKIEPCTIVFAYDGPAENAAQRLRQSIILEAPKGALLQFDRPLDLKSVDPGRLIGGRLDGPVTIRSDWKEPGPEDDLRIVTKDIVLTEQAISTTSPVDFRWGPHFGRGQDMVIKLLAGRPQPGAENASPNVSGIESFELRHVERLHLEVGQAMRPRGATAGSSSSAANTVGQANRGTPQSLPVEITCRGPFRFDVLGRVATFRDQVDVMVKENPAAPADQIACELLSLYFTDRPKEKEKSSPTAAPAANSLDLVAQRLVAQGNPAVVTAPSQKAKGGIVVSRAERFQYDLETKSIVLDGGQEVFLQQGTSEIHARTLNYQSAGEGRMGRVAAQGPGWLRGQSPDQPGQQLEAVWQDKLQVDPDGQKQVISLTGGAELKFVGVGQIQAREFFFWFQESPATGKESSYRLVPDLLWARNQVHMNTPELSCGVDDLKVRFDNVASGAGRGTEAGVRGMGGSPPISLAGQTSPAGVTSPAAAATQSPPQQTLPPPNPQTVLQRYAVTGQSLEAQASLAGQQPTVSTLTITGQPVRFEGPGLKLTSSNIHLDRGSNRLWIEGAGQMELPIKSTLSGQMPTGPGVLTVDWRRRMDFDGRTAQFENYVIATTGQQRMQTETMQVQLQRPVSFSQPSVQGPTDVEEIRCSGGVSIDSRGFDAQQQLKSHDQMQVTDLAINVQSGAINGGSGWLNSVFRGSPDLPGNTADGLAAGLPNNAARPDQLNCLKVEFKRSISGNLLLRQLTFRDHVQLAFAPVNNWDAMLTTYNPDKLDTAGNGVAASCDKLTVYQTSFPVDNRQTIALVGEGNTVVEGTTYTARGDRVSYDQSKDLLIFEGDGRSSAEFFQQSEPGAEGSRVAARKVFYWLKSRQVKVEGAQSLQMGQPPNGIKTR
jgi:lipopolysaccharide export system protein LptA